MSLFGDFGPSYLGMPIDSGNVLFAVQDFVSGATTGIQQFTSATIAGLTPAAVLLLDPNHDPTNDPNETAVFSVGIGMVAGGDDFHTGIWSADNSATTNTARHSHSGRVTHPLDNGGTGLKTATGVTISGGIELDYTTNNSPSLRAVFAAFAGSDVTAAVSDIDLTGGPSTLDQSTLGFEPDILLIANPCRSTGNLSLGMNYSFGIAVNDGSDTQRCVLWSEANGLGDSRPFQTLRTDCVAGEASDADGSLTYKVTASDFDASGFSVTTSASAGSDEIVYTALKLTGRRFKLVDFTTPTATGAFSITGVGFTPRFAILIGTNLEATDSHPGSTSDNQSGLSICLIGSDEQWSASWRINSGEVTTDTASQCSAVAIMGASATDCDAISGTFTAWTSDGVTLNITATQGSGKKFFGLFVE